MVFDSIKGEPRAKKMVLGACSAGKVAGAYLFQGQNTEEMSDFTREFAKFLNCPDLCGNCLNCKKIEAGVHPDLVTLMPEGKKQIIRIDSVRELKDRVRLGPAEAKYLVVRVINADCIEDAAANSFLKTLEEPPKNVVFVLITSSPDNLPKTVISRCQRVIFANQKEGADEIPQLPEGNDIYSLLQFSSALARLPKDNERQEAEKRLMALIGHFFKKRDLARARIILNSLKYLKRNANIKILFDHMALSLGGH